MSLQAPEGGWTLSALIFLVSLLSKALAAITVIRAFLHPRCCYSRVNTIRPQFITMLTGFRQRATTAAWADIWWQQSNVLTALIVCTVISIIDTVFKSVVLNYKYTALILITPFFPVGGIELPAGTPTLVSCQVIASGGFCLFAVKRNDS